jgi:L-threonylcarbamoyladenylate synthase
LNATAPRAEEAYLGFGSKDGPHNLSAHGDLVEAAANLFRMLHELDATGAKVIAVAPIPMTGLGEAINDRLKRAAAPRQP